MNMCQKFISFINKGDNMRIKLIPEIIGETEVFVVSERGNAETRWQSYFA